MSKIKNIDVEQAHTMLKQGAVLVDVRETAEYKNRHIPFANLHPLSEFEAKELSQYANKPVIVYCQKGARSEKACKNVLASQPNANIVNLIGGIDAWQQAGLETSQGSGNAKANEEANGMALDRQIHLLIGCLILIFSLLGYFVYFQLTMVLIALGALLVYMGATGFGGIARLVALAPWNRGG